MADEGYWKTFSFPSQRAGERSGPGISRAAGKGNLIVILRVHKRVGDKLETVGIRSEEGFVACVSPGCCWHSEKQNLKGEAVWCNSGVENPCLNYVIINLTLN